MRRKTGGKDFQPGQSGNPAGRKKLPPEVREAAKLTKAEVEATLGKFLKMSPAEFAEAKKSPATMGDFWIISVMSHGISKGDQMRLNFMYERLIGKVKDEVSVDGAIKVTVEDYTK